MKSTRRDLLKAGTLGALAVAAHGAGDAQGQAAADGPASPMAPLDYGRSFICHTGTANAVRFWVESRTRLIDDRNDSTMDFYQCASCKSEFTFAEKDLLQPDNYDFLPIFDPENILIFRRPVHLSERYRTISKTADVWGPPTFKLVEAKSFTELTTWEAMRDATDDAIPIVTHTELANPETGLRAIIECPTKTMNISPEKRMYQVDTGPVAFPDLSKRTDPPIDCLSLAFVVFNAPHFADFVIEQPTPVLEDEVEQCKVYHYSNPFSVPAKNRVLALDVV
ncbi:MAG: hypothetical protein GY851_15470 [bacterium]|nr:hypothetical protein [bacterium]